MPEANQSHGKRDDSADRPLPIRAAKQAALTRPRTENCFEGRLCSRWNEDERIGHARDTIDVLLAVCSQQADIRPQAIQSNGKRRPHPELQ